MISHTTEQFRKLLAQLPKDIQKQAKEAYLQFEKDPYIQGYASNEFIPSVLSMLFAYPEITGHWVSSERTK